THSWFQLGSLTRASRYDSTDGSLVFGNTAQRRCLSRRTSSEWTTPGSTPIRAARVSPGFSCR
ncbi:MAG TPA: hypothetical protein VM820_01635, partial [Vicinamibacterales bacterium]|nr:hypothetical protein [Vicinamibacterales bacterium]